MVLWQRKRGAFAVALGFSEGDFGSETDAANYAPNAAAQAAVAGVNNASLRSGNLIKHRRQFVAVLAAVAVWRVHAVNLKNK